jgi:hypothetical protein
MNFEHTVRQRHAFDVAAKGFLAALAGLTNEEIELALARVADRLVACSEETAQVKHVVRGRVLQLYLGLRTTSKTRHSSRMRRKLKPIAKELAMESSARAFRAEHAKLMEYWEAGLEKHANQLQQWESKWASRNWLWRLFKDGKPIEPAPPVERRAYIEWRQQVVPQLTPSDISDRLVEYASTYPLPPFPSMPEDLTQSDVELLSS